MPDGWPDNTRRTYCAHSTHSICCRVKPDDALPGGSWLMPMAIGDQAWRIPFGINPGEEEPRRRLR